MTINKGILNSGNIGGDASVSNLEGHFGDDIHLTSTGSIVDIKGQMERVRIEVRREPEIRRSLEGALGEIEELAKRFPAETRRVLSALELLLQELGAEKPDGDFLASSCELTRKALNELARVAPTLTALGENLDESVARKIRASHTR